MSQGASSYMAKASSKPARSWADLVKGDKVVTVPVPVPEAVTTLPEEVATVPVTLPEEVPNVAVTLSEAVQIPVDHEAAGLAPQQPPGIFTKEASSLKPGARGSLTCFCHGKVINMLSHYGWLEMSSAVDHPLSAVHGGRIYVQKSDIGEGQTLKAGDKVSFYLYADQSGLGAEVCQLQQEETETAAFVPRKDAAAFVPRKDAVAFVPGGVFPSPEQPVVDMFARMSRAFESIPTNGVVQMVGFNTAFFDDFSSDEEDDDEGDAADKESMHEESGNSSGDDAVPKPPAPQKSVLLAAPWKTRRAVSPDRTTNEGMSSDASLGVTSESENEGLPLAKYRALPPGLRMPAFRPPPGLSMIM